MNQSIKEPASSIRMASLTKQPLQSLFLYDSLEQWQ